MRNISKQNYALLVLGMACYWPMFRNNYFGLLFSEKTALIADSSRFYLALLVLLTLLGLLASCRPIWFTRLLEQRWSVPTASLSASLMTLAMMLVPASGILHLLLSNICVLATAFYFLLITLAWGTLLATTDFKRMMLWLALSFFLSYLFSTSSRLPGDWALLLPLCGPLVSGFAWLLQPHNPGDSRPFTWDMLRQPLVQTALVLILFLLIGSVIRGFFDLGVLSYAPSFETMPRSFISITLSLMLVFTVYLSSQYERLMNIFWVVFVLLFFAGLFVTSAFNSAWWQIGTDIVVMSRTFLGFFLWIVLINIAQRFRQSPVFLLGVLFIPTDCLSGGLTNFILPLFSAQLSLVPREYAGVFALAMALILLLGSFIFLGSLAFRNSSALKVVGEYDEDTRYRICTILASEHKLTVRECEVLYYISQGHSIKRIAETLFVSVSTIQTHAKSLYRKLSLHNRQQVIDLVSERLSPKA
jgi:DNA-binding CsgD family transcriptional regulator